METKGFVSPQQAASTAGVCLETIYNWIKEYGIGIKVGGRWKIDLTELQKILDGTMHKELTEKANGTQDTN